MRSPAEHSISRRVALLAVIGLHLLGGLLISRASRAPRAPQAAGPAMVWIGWPDASAANPQPVPSRGPRLRMPPAAVAATPALVTATPLAATPLVPAVPAPAQLATNWRLEAQRAAAMVTARAESNQQRDDLMGSTPKSPFRTRSARPEFPWSRQPLGKHFDVDAHAGTISLGGERCGMTLVYYLLPAFGCAVGPLNPEPGQGDLFDPKYQPQPLELPYSLSTVH